MMLLTDGLGHADIAALYELTGHGDVAPSAAAITRIRAEEDQRDAAIAEVAHAGTLDEVPAEAHRRAAEVIRQYVEHFHNHQTRHFFRRRKDGKVPPMYPRPDLWRIASSAGVLFAAHPAAVHELGPKYTLDRILATRPVEMMKTGELPEFPCDWRGPKCGPTGRSPAVGYLAVPHDQYLVLFGLCHGCESSVADLVGQARERRAVT